MLRGLLFSKGLGIRICDASVLQLNDNFKLEGSVPVAVPLRWEKVSWYKGKFS